MFKDLNYRAINESFSGVVSISKSNETLFEKAYGFSERNNRLLNSTNTKFGIASGTKLFTALGIGLLVDEGIISLDDSVFNILDYNFIFKDERVTISHLLTHTSGIPDYVDEDEIEDFDNFHLEIPWFKLENPDDYFPLMPKKGMEFDPGTRYKYNNGAYILLAAVISKVSGLEYAEFIKDRLLRPNEMNDTGFFRFDQMPENTATGYMDFGDSYRTNIYNLPIRGGGDGGIYTTVGDIKKLWSNMLDGNIISKSLLDIYIKPHVKTKEDDDTSWYGYGIYIEVLDDEDIRLSIVGMDAGVSFMSKYFLKNNSHYTVISNTSEGAWVLSQNCRDICKNL